MKFLETTKDGGPESTVLAHWLIEIKPLFSIALLRFFGESRECYHTHAFHSLSWVIRGKLKEEFLDKSKKTKIYKPSFIPIITTRQNFHKVSSTGTSLVLTFRGRWVKTWKENTKTDGTYNLTNGRNRV